MAIHMTAKAQLADVLLEAHGGLERFVTERRFRFQPITWQQVADDIEQATAGRVRVSTLALRSWFQDADAPPRASAVEDSRQPSLLDRRVS